MRKWNIELYSNSENNGSLSASLIEDKKVRDYDDEFDFEVAEVYCRKDEGVGKVSLDWILGSDFEGYSDAPDYYCRLFDQYFNFLLSGREYFYSHMGCSTMIFLNNLGDSREIMKWCENKIKFLEKNRNKIRSVAAEFQKTMEERSEWEEGLYEMETRGGRNENY